VAARGLEHLAAAKSIVRSSAGAMRPVDPQGLLPVVTVLHRKGAKRRESARARLRSCGMLVAQCDQAALHRTVCVVGARTPSPGTGLRSSNGLTSAWHATEAIAGTMLRLPCRRHNACQPEKPVIPDSLGDGRPSSRACRCEDLFAPPANVLTIFLADGSDCADNRWSTRKAASHRSESGQEQRSGGSLTMRMHRAIAMRWCQARTGFSLPGSRVR